LIEHHLEDLRDNRLPAIKRKTGYSIEKIKEVWEELRKLNPKPEKAGLSQKQRPERLMIRSHKPARQSKSRGNWGKMKLAGHQKPGRMKALPRLMKIAIMALRTKITAIMAQITRPRMNCWKELTMFSARPRRGQRRKTNLAVRMMKTGRTIMPPE